MTRLRRLALTGTSLLLCAGLMVAGESVVASGASPKVPGVTKTQITIGATVPLTGIAAQGYSEVAKAANAVFKYVNSKGGSRTSSSASSQAGIRTPKVWATRSQLSTEFTGRCAGKGYSLLAIGVSVGQAACLLRNALANPNHVAAPEQVR